MVISQGDVWWVDLPEPRGSEPAGRRPAFVLQHDRFNRTRLGTVVVLAITSNLRLGGLPGNITLARGEANLSMACVVNVTHIHAMDRRCFRERIGAVTRERLRQVWAGACLLLEAPG